MKKNLQNRRERAIERIENRIKYLTKVIDSSATELTEGKNVLTKDDLSRKLNINQVTLENTKAKIKA